MFNKIIDKGVKMLNEFLKNFIKILSFFLFLGSLYGSFCSFIMIFATPDDEKKISFKRIFKYAILLLICIILMSGAWINLKPYFNFGLLNT